MHHRRLILFLVLWLLVLWNTSDYANVFLGPELVELLLVRRVHIVQIDYLARQ